MFEKESAFVSYGGDDKTTKMLSDAVNKLTHDVRHDHIIVGKYETECSQNDLNVVVEKNSIELVDGIYFHGDHKYYIPEEFPLTMEYGYNGTTVNIYHVGSPTSPEFNYVDSVAYRIDGLQKENIYTLSFNIRTDSAIEYLLDDDFVDNLLFGIVISSCDLTSGWYYDTLWHRDICDRLITPPDNCVRDHYYNDIQYYSFPGSGQSKTVSISFMSFNVPAYPTHLYFVLEGFKSYSEIINDKGESWYNDNVKNKVLIELSNVKIDQYDVYGANQYGTIKSLGCTYIDNAYYRSMILDNSYYSGSSAPDNTKGSDGNYYVQYGTTFTSNFSLTFNEAKDWVNNSISHDASGYSISASVVKSYEYAPKNQYIAYTIGNLTVGKKYILQFDGSVTANVQPSEPYCTQAIYIGLKQTRYVGTNNRYYTYDVDTEVYKSAETMVHYDFNTEQIIFSATSQSVDIIAELQDGSYSLDDGVTIQLQLNHFRVSEYKVNAVWYKINGFWTKFEASGGGGGASSLGELTDVIISNPLNGQALVYDSANDVWINKTNTTTYYGTSDPLSGQGLNGDIYIKYANGFGVSRIFGKISNTWMTYNPYIEYEWDFTKSLYAINNETAATLTKATRSSSGISISDTNQYVDFPKQLLRRGYTYEFTITSLSIVNTSNNNRLFVFSTTNPHNAGLYWQGASAQWCAWDDINGVQRSGIEDPTFFNNCVVKIVIGDDGKWHIYKDGTVVFEPPTALAIRQEGFGFGSSTLSCNSMTISRFRIYPNIV